MLIAAAHHPHLLLDLERAVKDAHQRDHADVAVKPRINNERFHRRIRGARWRRDFLNDLLQQVFNTLAGFRAHLQRFRRIQPDDFLDFLHHPFRLGRRQVNLVQNGQHLQILLDGGVTVRHRLRLNALRRVHHEQRALAGIERARHFVREIDVAGGVDEVELIRLPVLLRSVIERDALRLDGNAAFPFQIHGIQHLRLHFALGQAAAHLDEAVREGGFAVVNMGDDGKIADALKHGAVRGWWKGAALYTKPLFLHRAGAAWLFTYA